MSATLLLRTSSDLRTSADSADLFTSEQPERTETVGLLAQRRGSRASVIAFDRSVHRVAWVRLGL